MAGHYALEILDDRSVYTLSGDFDARVTKALWRSVQREFTTCERLLIDLRRLRSCHHDARPILLEVHRIWAERAQHVAYLATDPRIRGLSLWLVRTAGDNDAKNLGSEAQVDEWMGRGDRRSGPIVPVTVEQERPLPLRGPAPTPTDQSSSQTARWAMQIVLGLRPPWFDELVRIHGFPGLKRWSDAVQLAVETLTEHHGELLAQVLLGLSALWNGCLYCSRGHLLAANLLYFESTKGLFPLCEDEVSRWHGSSEDAVLTEIEERLESDELRGMGELVLLQGRIKLGRVAVAGDDATAHALVQAESAWTLINGCGRPPESAQVPPLHPRLSRDWQIQTAYRQARRQSGVHQLPGLDTGHGTGPGPGRGRSLRS
jgi:hypothetical protein